MISLQGCYQRPGFDFIETFSLVIKTSTVWVVLIVALAQIWEIIQLDVNNAFLNGILHETVLIKQLPGLEKSTISVPLVYKLRKALYGLRQAPRVWFDKLKYSVLQLGFVSSKTNQSLFLRFTSTSRIYLLVYVDDIIIT